MHHTFDCLETIKRNHFYHNKILIILAQLVHVFVEKRKSRLLLIVDNIKKQKNIRKHKLLSLNSLHRTF